MNQLKTFFWSCAGANREILKKCPSDASKYVGIGATIVFTGLFAAIAGAYALYTIFDNWFAAVGFGIIWGAMIFNLDRFIVSSMRKNGKPLNEWVTAFPRIVLAVFISIVIAKPLELKMFDKEIEGEITLMEEEQLAEQEYVVRSRYTEVNERLKADIAQLKNEIDRKSEKRDELRTIAQQEADGTGGTGKRNPGPIYRIKKADADRVEAELLALSLENNKLIDQKNAQLASNEANATKALEELKKQTLNGLASRLEALDRLTQKSEAIWIANFFLMMLFLAVETAPVLVKLISPRGPYDYLVKAEEYGFEAGHYEDLAKVNAAIKKRSNKFTEDEIDFILEKLKVSLNQS